MSTPADNPATPLPEARGYRVLGELGHGGMSTVYLAEQLALGRQVALKVMSPQALGDETSRRRFENEVRTIARLEHPNIVRIHELGRTADGLPFYSMPHLPRGHLGSRDYTRDSATVVKLAGSLLAALEYAHSRNVVHRDVKPENILFDEAGRPLLADFGIALQRGFGPRVTAAGMAVGSTAYMAPEQARGEDVDGRADLYAMGVVIWEMLAGRLPYEAQDALSMAIMHAQSPIPKLPRHLAHWQKFMQRALAKDPAQRFQTATEMREALRAVRIPQGTPMGERARAAWASRRFRLGTAVALGLVAVAAAAALLPGRMSDGFFRPEPTVAPVRVTPPKPAPVDSALPAPPDNRAALEAALTQATTHLQRGELVEPASGNAVSALLTAWHADPADPRVAQGLDALLRAMGERTGAHVRARRDDDARALYARAQEVAKATGQTASPAHATLGEAAKAAAVARMEQAARQGEREPSEKALALAREFGLTRREATRLQAKLAATVRKGGGEAQESGVRVPLRPVSRSEYERFAQTTGRPASICRERASVLRVFKPRDWRNPGFAQGPSDAVVCVSLRDAEAYAQWLSAREGARYRLPSGDESNTVAPAFTGRTVGLWLRDCGGSCRERRVTTGSWRGRGGAQALAGDRGYDDVGFRLIREK